MTNWDDFRFFLAVARTGRSSAAAKQLGVDHATVGRRIKALETRLDTLLFDRSPQGFSLTAAGERLIESAQAIESDVISAQGLSGQNENPVSGAIRIGAPEGVATYLLADCAAELCRRYPRLEIQIVALPRTFSLSKREADIAIAVSPPTSGRLKCRKIADYTLHMYGAKSYLDKHPPIRQKSDLFKVRGIGYVRDLIYDKELDYIPLVLPDIRPHLTSTSLHVQLEATLRGAGVCILHDFLVARYANLVRVLPEEISFTRTFWYIVHEDYSKLEHIRIVSDFLIKHMQKVLRA